MVKRKEEDSCEEISHHLSEEWDYEEIEYDEKKFDQCSPFPDQPENEIIAIESFYQCFNNRYEACPVFCVASLYDACQTALYSPMIDDRRPLLVYIHSDRSIFYNIFCSRLFCSEITIQYLLNNYVVWPWDITIPSNAEIFKQKWIELFSSEFAEMFVNDRCPMLIGIMRRSRIESNSKFPSGYKFQILLENDRISRTGENVTLATVFQELIIFKENYEENENNLLSNPFHPMTRCNEFIYNDEHF